MPITLNATQVPLPMTFSGATPVIGDVAPGTGPLTSEMMDSGEKVPFTTTKFNKHGLRQDLVSRYGAGFYFLADGGVLTAGAGLLLNVAFLHAGVDGTVEIAAQSIALTDSTRNHIWAKRDGTLEARTDLTQPSQAAGYLGSALCAGGSISSVDESGVLYSRMGNPWRETADAGVPGDTPTADHAGMLTKTAGGVYLWDGAAYQLLAPTGGGGTLGVASGGTGADLSATGGAGQVVFQEGVGDPFTVRVLAAADLPTIATDKILGRATAGTGAVEELAALPFAFSGGDVVSAADSNVLTIDNDAVTFAKLQNITGPVVIGKETGTGDAESLSLSPALNISLGTLAVANASTTVAGVVELATDGEGIAGRAVQGNDSRLSDPWRPTGDIAATLRRSEITTASLAALLTQRMRLDGVYLKAGDTVTNIAYWTGGTAANTPTNWWFALYSYHASAPVLLGQTADQLTAAMAANTKFLLPLGTPVNITSTGLYYVAIMVKATTVPTLRGMSNSLQFINEEVPVRGGITADTGLTDTAPNPSGAITTAEEFIPYAQVS